MPPDDPEFVAVVVAAAGLLSLQERSLEALEWVEAALAHAPSLDAAELHLVAGLSLPGDGGERCRGALVDLYRAVSVLSPAS